MSRLSCPIALGCLVAISMPPASLAQSTKPADKTPVLVQAETGVAPTPIPPASTGTVELQEIKPTLSVDVKTSQSRVYRTKKKIKRVSVSDPSIAEPVVVSDHEFVLLGKAPGNVSVVVWFE